MNVLLRNPRRTVEIEGTGDVCAFCHLVEVAAGHDPVPVEMLRPAKARR